MKQVDLPPASGPKTAEVRPTASCRYVHRETSDTYRGVLFRSDRFRVAICRDGLQWLFQRRRIHPAPGGAAWDTLGYCVTRKALARLYREHMGSEPPELFDFPGHLRRGDSS